MDDPVPESRYIKNIFSNQKAKKLPKITMDLSEGFGSVERYTDQL